MKRIRRVSLTLMVLVLVGFDGGHRPPRAGGFETKPPAEPRKPTAESRRAIQRGTHWLLGNMRVDGGVRPDSKLPPDLGCTAITGLVLLSQGSTPNTGPHRQELTRILHYLLSSVEDLPGDEVPVEANTQIQRKIGRYAPLFLMGLFFSQVHGEERTQDNESVRAVLVRLVNFISAKQQPDGTWGDNSWAPVLGTVLGWECLRAAASVGVRVNASSKAIGEALLARLRQRNANEASNWMFQFYKETASLRVLFSLGYEDTPEFRQCMDRVLALPRSDQRLFQNAGGEEYLAFYIVTECALKHQRRHEPSAAWYPFVREKLVRLQNADGSWTGHHCITSRTFCTAAALMTLQAPNGFLPISDM